MSKVTVVGAGHVGEMTTFFLSEMDLAELVVIDIVEDMPQGKALDMYEGTPVRGSDCKVRGTNDWADIQGSDIVVVTAGLARKPGMSRDDLQKKNADIIGDISTQIKERAPGALVVMVTNPLDVMAYHACKVTGFSPNRVVGMAGVLDSTRLRSFIAMELNLSVLDVQAMVLGGHGDSMVPLVRHATVAGIPVTELVPKDRLDAIVERTRMGGGEIVKLLKTGSAYYAPAAAAAQMVDSILKNRRRILPCAAYLTGQYGMSDIYLGVPVILGANGVEEILEIDLTPEEMDALRRSGEAVASQVKLL